MRMSRAKREEIYQLHVDAVENWFTYKCASLYEEYGLSTTFLADKKELRFKCNQSKAKMQLLLGLDLNVITTVEDLAAKMRGIKL